MLSAKPAPRTHRPAPSKRTKNRKETNMEFKSDSNEKFNEITKEKYELDVTGIKAAADADALEAAGLKRKVKSSWSLIQ